MWNYGMLPDDGQLIAKFSKHATIAGIVMTILGILAIVYPFSGALFTVAFVAWLMIFGGVMAGFATAKTNPKDWLGWLKAFILIVTGVLMIFMPGVGIQAIALILAIYFLMDTFAGFAMGSMMRPLKGWWLWTLNGVLSLILAIIFLTSWINVAQTAWLIGIFVGISLLFDGVVLLVMGNRFKKLASEK
ncbi:HdeD family acid-resistance protein [Nitratifractor sp.]